MLNDISSSEDIRLLVDTFYDRVKTDPVIGPVFAAHIQDWTPHLSNMYAFWGSLLLEEHSYAGHPFAKHIPLAIDSHHFTAWIGLFSPTVDELFSGPKAEEAKVRAVNIARIFESKLRMMRIFNEAAEAAGQPG